MLQQIRKLEEFTAAEGTFTQDVDLEQDAKYLPDFLKGERVVALVTGTVRATVDFSDLDEDAIEVDESTDTIRLTLPEPGAERRRHRRGLGPDHRPRPRPVRPGRRLLRGQPDRRRPAVRGSRAQGRAPQRESDLVEEGQPNTEQWLKTFLGAAGFEHVEITWQKSPA